jgi:hypothetical protein
MEYKLNAWDYVLAAIGASMLALSVPAYYKSAGIELQGNPCHESFHSGVASPGKAGSTNELYR